MSRFPASAALLSWVLFVGVSRASAQQALPAPIKVESKPYIDQLLRTAWQAERLTPADRTSDTEFLRRAYLDITGELPRTWEVRIFEQDPSPDKRPRLIDRLLDSEAYARHWASLWTGWLMSGPIPVPDDRGRLNAWLCAQLTANVSHKQLMEKLLTATGKPADNPATLFALNHLGRPVPANRQANEGPRDVEPLTWRSIRLFLGMNANCNRCHDHPFDAEVKLKHFWMANYFFRQVDRTADGALADDPRLNPKGIGYYRGRSGVMVPVAWGQFIDGRKPVLDGDKPRRQAVAELIATHPNFGRALVNRMWGHFFGRGLDGKRIVDDFGEHNEVLHAALLAQLSQDFTDAGHDYKKLIRWICTSDAYQLRSAANTSNLAAAADGHFSRMPLKELSPRQRLEALLRALRADETLTRKDEPALRQRWLTVLVRPEVDDELDYDICVYHAPVAVPFEAAQLMVYDDAIRAALVHPAGTVARAQKAGKPARVLDELYLAALSRHPTERETAWIEKELEQVRKDPANSDEAFWQDLFFALLNCGEFIFNH